jgi:hypothetical protein
MMVSGNVYCDNVKIKAENDGDVADELGYYGKVILIFSCRPGNGTIDQYELKKQVVCFCALASAITTQHPILSCVFQPSSKTGHPGRGILV